MAKLWGMTSIALVLLLCAACTTVSADVPPQRTCSRYVNLFLERTEHARPPADAGSKEWVNFATAEAGQLGISNRDKDLARKVLAACEAEGAEATARAERALKPFWKRVFTRAPVGEGGRATNTRAPVGEGGRATKDSD
jgi:hypothetical protein